MGKIDGVQALVNQRSLTAALSGNIEGPICKSDVNFAKSRFEVHFLVIDPAIGFSAADDASNAGAADLVEGYESNIQIALNDASRGVPVLLVAFFEDGVNSLIHRIAIFCLDVIVKDHRDILTQRTLRTQG